MKHFFLCLLCFGLLAWPAWSSQGQNPDRIKVFIWSDSPQARAVLSGLERLLGQDLPVVSAGADYGQGEILVRQLAREPLRLLIVLGTQALTLTAPAIKKTPVVFAMVADPYHSGAAYHKNRPEDHQENIVGLASPPPLAEAIRQTLQLFPHRRHWGLLYDPREGPSVELQQLLAEQAHPAGLQLTVVPVGPGVSPTTVVQALPAQGVQVLFLPPDQLSGRYANTAARLGQERRLVVVNGNPRLPGQGAVLSVTLDYEAVGAEAARLAQRLLQGEKPKNIPIAQYAPARVEVNEALLNQWAGYPPEKP